MKMKQEEAKKFNSCSIQWSHNHFMRLAKSKKEITLAVL